MRTINNIVNKNPSQIKEPAHRAAYMYSLYLGGDWLPFIPQDPDLAQAITLHRYWSEYLKANPYAKGSKRYTNVISNFGIIRAYQILFPDGRIWDSHDRAFLDLRLEPYDENL